MTIKQWLLVASTVFLGVCNVNAQAPQQDNLFEISKNLDIYFALFKEVNQYYVDPTQPGQMVKNSIDAMLEKLDPFTNYITEDDIEDYRIQNTGRYGGIGSTLRKVNGFHCIDEIVENGPLVKAGIKTGDILLSVDGKEVKNYSIDDIGKLLKGSPGTTLKLSIKDAVTGAVTERVVTREEITIKNVINPQLMGPGNAYAYVKLTQFSERATANVKAALDSLKKANPQLKGVILDLRSNPGGLLEEAISLCNLFVPRDVLIVSTKGKVEEWIKDYKTQNLPWDENIPLVVLINKGSASASEIVSGTMQDLDRGIVIGQRSYGKGLVQNTRNLPFNAKLKVTTAKYYIPSGRCIQALDYSNRNEDGSVGAVPDSLKKMFKTKAGRKVYDGGGIDPDIKTTSVESNSVVKALLSENLIFEYANKYVREHATIAPAQSFKLSDAEVDAFMAWLATQKFQYKTKTDEFLEKLRGAAEKENYLPDIKQQLETLQAAVDAEKKQEIAAARKDIGRTLQAEIVSRYYYQSGKVLNLMQDDEELKQALEILGNSSKYNSLLGK